ncbi:MAG: type II toxin-antitoxin system RelE/ParE family toxin [Oligoflexia bacterium]|nr:type II toxin-antitoxin system RelE/ParE family toxin [Oligoflexia bacterium]
MIKIVKLTKKVEKQIKQLPEHIVTKFHYWVHTVATFGLEEARKIKSFHDEPLKGKLSGLRSIRLSNSYRAYYIIDAEGATLFVLVERIDKHGY